MSKKWHLNLQTGDVRECRTTVGQCPYGSSQDEQQQTHFSSYEQAQEISEYIISKNNPVEPLKKKSRSKFVRPEQIVSTMNDLKQTWDTKKALQLADAFASNDPVITNAYKSQQSFVSHFGDAITQEAQRRSGVNVSQMIDDAERLKQRAKVKVEKDHSSSNEDEKKYYLAKYSSMSEARLSDYNKLVDEQRRLLREIRPFGGTVNLGFQTKKDAREVFSKAAEEFPSDWLKEAAKVPVMARISSRRSHFGFVSKRIKKRISGSVMQESAESLRRNSYYNDPYYTVEVPTREALVGTGWSEDGLDRYIGNENYSVVYENDVIWGDSTHKPSGSGWRWRDVPDESGVHEGAWVRRKFSMKDEGFKYVCEMTTTPQWWGEDQSNSTAKHEMSHYFESGVKGVRQIEQEFLKSRLGDIKEAKKVELYQDQNKKKSEKEWAYEGDFVDPYVGKVYPSGDSEVLSVGMQTVFHADNGAGLGFGNCSSDVEYRNTIIGMLALVGRPPKQ